MQSCPYSQSRDAIDTRGCRSEMCETCGFHPLEATRRKAYIRNGSFEYDVTAIKDEEGNVIGAKMTKVPVWPRARKVYR